MRTTPAVVLMTIAVALVARVPAAITGSVLAISDNSQWGWTAGPLVRIDLPSLTRTTLSGNSCMGPCFSPDGAKVAFSSGDKIHIVSNKGTGDTIVNVSVPTGRMPALYWLRISGRDYIYWSLGPQGTTNCMDIYRADIATGVKETVYTTPDNIGIKWAGISADGTRAAVTKAHPLFNAYLVDLVGKREVGRGVGCNASLSPDGTLFTHNTWIDQVHENAYIEYFDMTRPTEDVSDYNLTAKPAGAIFLKFHPESGCQFDTQRFSHSSNDYITYRQYQCTGTTSCGNAGIVMNIRTGEKVCFGAGCGYDFWAGSLDTPARLDAPQISPASGNVSASPVRVTMAAAVSGVSIRYTVDGSDPTSRSLLYQASVDVPVTRGASVTVKARAYKTGSDSSVVSQATYAYATTQPAITVLAPNGGERSAVGQTVRIRWQADLAIVSAAVLKVSTDSGLNWHVVVAAQIKPTDATWGDYPWLVPSAVDGVSLSNVNAIIKIHDYVHEEVYDESDAEFRIDGGASVAAFRQGRQGQEVPRRATVGVVGSFRGAGIPNVYDVNGRKSVKTKGPSLRGAVRAGR